jgi:anti-sigma-K factor RskA
MMNITDHEERREQAALYVLGTLPPAERATFEEHLSSCAECSADVRALAPVTTALAQVVPQAAPPPQLRERVLAAVDASANHIANSRGGHRGAPNNVPWLAAAAALVLAAALGAYTAQLRTRISTLEDQLRAAALRVGESERQIAEARQSAIQAQSTVAVLAAPDLARADLAGQAVAPGASGRAFWSRSRGLVFTGSNLPPLPPGRVYQLWVVTPNAPISAGLLRPDAQGRVSSVTQTPANLPQPVAMALTVEPEGGVPAPTGDRYLVGAVIGAKPAAF